MKRLTLKKTLILFILPATLFAFTTKADKVNFSGSWKLNENKGELGENGARYSARKIKVEQKDDAIVVTKTFPGFNGSEDRTSTETLTYDGKVSEIPAFANSKKKSTLKWADDGQSLIVTYSINFDMNGQTGEIKGVDTWTLSADGKELTSSIASSTPQGDFNIKAVYDKE